MSVLAPMVINTLLGTQMSHGSSTHGSSSAVTEKYGDLVRKHYSSHYDGGGYGHSGHSYPSYSYHGGYGGKKKSSRNVALSALTLLAFLFFLHILQQCLHEQMQATTATPQMVVMQATIQAAREAEEAKLKEAAQKRVGQTDTTEKDGSKVNVGTVKRFETVPIQEDLYHYERVPVKAKNPAERT